MNQKRLRTAGLDAVDVDFGVVVFDVSVAAVTPFVAIIIIVSISVEIKVDKHFVFRL